MNDQPKRNMLESVAYEKLFSTWDQDFVNSPKGAEAVDEVLYRRQKRAEDYALKWIDDHVPLADAYVVEVGCGTGAASIPLARVCKHLVGLDIDTHSIEVAKARAEYCRNPGNVEFVAVPPEHLLDKALSYARDVDVFILYAVLEHMTPSERLRYLRAMWNELPAGGAIVVIETPNRLTWEDKHTAYMDFFHMLPDEYVCAYAERSPRPYFAETMRRLQGDGFSESRYRWGLGASYHEFELAFNETLAEIVVADGLEDEMVAMFPIDLDERALRKYFMDRPIPQPIGFSRAVLNLIFRKPGSDSERRANVRYNQESLARERENLQRMGGRISGLRRFLGLHRDTSRLKTELDDARRMALERYRTIQEMDAMLRQRDAEIAELKNRLVAGV